jgi:tetratricopeptide (TPR) repeat protein
MKKVIIILAAMSFGMGASAQKAKIYTAKEYMRNGDMKKAIIAINEATSSENTKGDGDAWFTRGEIYEKLAETDPTAIEESTKSYMKVLEVKPNYDKDVIDNKLVRIAYKAYNAGVLAYAGDANNNVKSDYDAAIKSFQQVVDIREIQGGKHYASNKKFDTVAGQALKFQALSAYYAKKDDMGLSVLIKAKNNPVARDPYIFSTLVDVYTEKKDNASIEKTLEEAKALYPKNAEISRQEMNYYLRANKTDVLIQKMEEAVKSDPDNSLLQYNLGVLYSSMANPIDDAGNPKEKPDNSKDYEAKAVMAYKLAIDADPNKAEYSYNLGALYFNNAADITKKMNAISGTTEADNKKYDALKVLRTAEFTKALPYFQKAYDLLNPKLASLNADDKSTLRNTLVAMQTIYEAFGQAEKADAMGKKMAELGQ